MVDEPIFSLLLVESDLERPRTLRRGTLGACLDALKDAGMTDFAQRNRARYEIIVTDPDGGPGATHILFTICSVWEGS